MSTAATYQRNQETPATISDIIAVTIALKELLVEETVFMDAMQIDKVGELQARKLKLTGLLERYTRYVHQHQQLLTHMAAEEKAELQRVSRELNLVMKKNYDVLLVARAVNGAIVKCVTETKAKKDTNPIYNAQGANASVYRSAISITLNETI